MTEALTWMVGNPPKAVISILVTIFVLGALWIVQTVLEK